MDGVDRLWPLPRNARNTSRMGMGSPRVTHELVSQARQNVLARPLCERPAHAILSLSEAFKIDQIVQCQRRVPAAVTRHMRAYLDWVG